jgi:hypothetical protein
LRNGHQDRTIVKSRCTLDGSATAQPAILLRY